MHHCDFLIAQIFFGLWLVPLGSLVYYSGMFPRALVVGGVCYLVDTLAAFLLHDLGEAAHTLLAIPPSIAELWMVAYLLVRGVRPAALAAPIPASA